MLVLVAIWNWGVIKIKLNNKIYCYIPYSTIKLIKGRELGSLSLVDKVNLGFEKQILSVERNLQNSQAFAMSHDNIIFYFNHYSFWGEVKW